MNANETNFSLFNTFQAPTERPGGWAFRHNQALLAPAPEEAKLVEMLRALVHTANMFGADVFGFQEVVMPVARATRTSLNYSSGRLDCGTLDGGILRVLFQTAALVGISEDDVEAAL